MRSPFSMRTASPQALLCTCVWLMLLSATHVHAQESVKAQLDACILEQEKSSVTSGAELGALGGLSLGGGHSSRNASGGKNSGSSGRGMSLNLGIGAAAGGALGLASAYFHAVGRCFELHPSWIPASQLQRSHSFEEAQQQSGYQPEDGVMALATQLDMPREARPESQLLVRARFMVLTPDGAESLVQVERHLFAVVDGQSTELPLPARAQDQRIFEAGEHEDLLRLPIPKNAPLGVSYRIELRVSVPHRPESVASAQVKVI